MGLLLTYRFLFVMNQPAFVDALPVLGKELPVSTGLQGGMILLPADKTFHESRLLVDELCGMFFLRHNAVSLAGRII